MHTPSSAGYVYISIPAKVDEPTGYALAEPFVAKDAARTFMDAVTTYWREKSVDKKGVMSKNIYRTDFMFQHLQ